MPRYVPHNLDPHRFRELAPERRSPPTRDDPFGDPDRFLDYATPTDSRAAGQSDAPAPIARFALAGIVFTTLSAIPVVLAHLHVAGMDTLVLAFTIYLWGPPLLLGVVLSLIALLQALAAAARHREVSRSAILWLVLAAATLGVHILLLCTLPEHRACPGGF